MRSPQLGQIPRLGPCHLASSAVASVWPQWAITSSRWTAGEPSVRLLATLWVAAGVAALAAAPTAAQSPPAGDAQDPARLRRVGFDAHRRRQRHAEDRRGQGGRGRPARHAPALDAGRAARLRRHQALAADRQGVQRLEPRPADRPGRPRAGRGEDPLLQGQGPHPDRLRAPARRRGPRDLGPRTIVLVSDGKDTCQPPSPCEVAQEISKGGVEMRIQAIGFNVDQDAKRELECIATRRRRRLPRGRGRGVAQAGAEHPVDARAAPVRHQGRAGQRRRARAQATAGRARPLPRRHAPGQERWYAIDLAAGRR